MIQSIRDISFSGTGAQSQDINLGNDGVQAYRISINTVSQILGDKTVAFVGTPVNNLTVLDFILEGGINTSGVSKLKIGGVTISDRFAANKCMVRFEYYNSAWNVFYYVDDSASGSIDGSQLIDDSVTPVKITDAIAGSGMERDGSGGVKVKLEASNPTLQIVGDETGAKLDATGAVVGGSNGMRINIETSDPSLQISGNQLGIKIDVNGGIQKTASGTSVKTKAGGGVGKDNNGVYVSSATYHIIASFDADSNNGSFMVRIPYTTQVTAIRGMVNKSVSGTDDGTIEFKSATSFGGGASPLAGPYTIPMSSPLSTVVINDVSNYVPAGYDGLGGWYLQVIMAKVTNGGQVYLSIDVASV